MSDKPPRYASWTAGKLPLPELQEMKRRGEKIVMVTAYDAPSARLADAAGVDLILVGDSSGMVMHGRESTVPVTLDEIVFMTQWVSRGAKRPIVVADMPFGSYETSNEQAVGNAVRLVKEGGADAVKLERGGTSVARAKAIVDAGIPVMGHVGLTPQTATVLGGFKAQGRTADRAEELIDDALALQAAGCFAIVLEAVPEAGGARRDEGARRADDRHRRRRGDRRTGARLARHARLLRRSRAALRQALRGDRRGNRRRARALRRRSAQRCVPGEAAHVRDARGGAGAVRSYREAASTMSTGNAAASATVAAALPHVQPCTVRTPTSSSQTLHATKPR